MNEYNLRQFIDNELDDGNTLEQILEEFNLDPADVFVFLFNSGLIDPDLLNTYILDV